MKDQSTLLAYDLHGSRITFESEALLAGALHERLGQLPAASSGTADLAFRFHAVPSLADHVVDLPPPGARLVNSSDLGEFRYDEDSGALFIVCGDRVRACCDTSCGQVQTSIACAAATDLWLLSHAMVTIPLTEIAKHRGLFSVHAAAVAIGGV
ncbi:MAG: hypothetical protein ACRDIE_25865, partial [Chloroflexota bacterium]